MEKEKAPSGSRFRRWILGTGLVLAIVLIGPLFVPAPAPPFKFLDKAELRYIRVDSDYGATASYMVRGDWKSIDSVAEAELRGWSHGKDSTGADEFVLGNRRVIVVDWNFGSEKEPFTHVLYEYPPRFVDRIRSPVHHIRSWF